MDSVKQKGRFKMKIGIASDHRGVILKEKIKNYLNDRYQIIVNKLEILEK